MFLRCDRRLLIRTVRWAHSSLAPLPRRSPPKLSRSYDSRPRPRPMELLSQEVQEANARRLALLDPSRNPLEVEAGKRSRGLILSDLEYTDLYERIMLEAPEKLEVSHVPAELILPPKMDEYFGVNESGIDKWKENYVVVFLRKHTESPYRNDDECNQVLKEYTEIHGGVPTAKLTTALVALYGVRRDLMSALTAVREMRRYGEMGTIEVYGALLNTYAKCEESVAGHKLLMRMAKNREFASLRPTAPCFTAIVNGLAKEGHINLAWTTYFESLRMDIAPDVVTVTVLLHACARAQEPERAIKLFNSTRGLVKMDPHAFGGLLAACARRPDHFQYAFRLAHEMQTDGMALNKHHYVELLLSCSTVSDIVAADRVFELATKTTPPDQRMFNALLRAYTRSYVPIDVRDKVEPQLKPQREYLPFISDAEPVDMKGQVATARELLNKVEKRIGEMDAQGIAVAPVALNALISALGNVGDIEGAMRVYSEEFERRGVIANGQTMRFLMGMCARAVDWRNGLRVWRDVLVATDGGERALVELPEVDPSDPLYPHVPKQTRGVREEHEHAAKVNLGERLTSKVAEKAERRASFGVYQDDDRQLRTSHTPYLDLETDFILCNHYVTLAAQSHHLKEVEKVVRFMCAKGMPPRAALTIRMIKERCIDIDDVDLWRRLRGMMLKAAPPAPKRLHRHKAVLDPSRVRRQMRHISKRQKKRSVDWMHNQPGMPKFGGGF